MNITATFALAGTTAVATAPILIVREPFAGNAGAILCERAAHFLEALLQRDFGAVQFLRALENAVG